MSEMLLNTVDLIKGEIWIRKALSDALLLLQQGKKEGACNNDEYSEIDASGLKDESQYSELRRL
jgi:hypothetical protein